MKPKLTPLFSLGLLFLAACVARQSQEEAAPHAVVPPADPKPESKVAAVETATFGGGCFWCTEALFTELKGVTSVKSGYSGGTVENPTYEQVSTGRTGHAEVIQIEFDPSVVSYDNLLQIHWQTHDPTTLNRQGHDEGTQYRSVIFYHNDAQKEKAESYKAKIEAAGVFPAPVVTEIVPFKAFYPAEDYHQNYYARNADKGYSRAVIRPKLDKLRAIFEDKLKK